MPTSFVARLNRIYARLGLPFQDDSKTHSAFSNVGFIAVLLLTRASSGPCAGTLTHQMLKFRAASGFLMAQTYLSTVLLFSGFYLIIYRLDVSASSYVSGALMDEWMDGCARQNPVNRPADSESV